MDLHIGIRIKKIKKKIAHRLTLASEFKIDKKKENHPPPKNRKRSPMNSHWHQKKLIANGPAYWHQKKKIAHWLALESEFKINIKIK